MSILMEISTSYTRLSRKFLTGKSIDRHIMHNIKEKSKEKFKILNNSKLYEVYVKQNNLKIT